ncbi:unnamed protein product [Penicillium manginii]
MIDKTMLAPGPAGTSMLGERSIDAAGRRGLERQARERREQEEKMGVGNENRTDFESGVGDGVPRTQKGQMHLDAEGRKQDQEQAQGLQFQNESAEGDYSDGPIHSRLERDGDGDGKKKGIWGRIARKLTGV